MKESQKKLVGVFSNKDQKETQDVVDEDTSHLSNVRWQRQSSTPILDLDNPIRLGSLPKVTPTSFLREETFVFSPVFKKKHYFV